MKRYVQGLIASIYNYFVDADYYISSSTGDDLNDGLTPATAWASLTKLNTVTYTAGQTVAFKRGDTFYGSLSVGQSGTSGNPITFRDYGVGSKPKISGFTEITAFTETTDVWESDSAVSALSTCNVVLISDVIKEKGKFPTTGYYNIDSAPSATLLTSADFDGVTDWSGAKVRFKQNRWNYDEDNILSQAGTTITTDGVLDSGGKNYQTNFGFFITDDGRVLDTNDEWYYDTSTKKLSIFSTGTSPTVKVSTVDELVTLTARDYITFKNLHFEGANSRAIEIQRSRYIIVNGCVFSNCYEGIRGFNWQDNLPTRSFGCEFYNNAFTNCLNFGIALKSEFGNIKIYSNNLTDIGMFTAFGLGFGANTGIRSDAENGLIYNNTVNNVGWNGISFSGNNTKVYQNFVNNTTALLDDGGCIYTGGSPTGREIYNNICLYSVGNSDGTSNTATNSGSGIYLDEQCIDVDVYDNVSAFNGLGGIKLHKGTNNNVTNNLFFSSLNQINLENYNGTFSGNDISNNISVAKTGQTVFWIYSYTNTISSLGTMGLNIYSRPIDNGNNIHYQQPSSGSINTNLAGWQSFSGLDGTSTDPAYSVLSDGDFVFEYNASDTIKTITIVEDMKDFEGNLYPTGNVNIPAWSGIVLIPQ